MMLDIEMPAFIFKGSGCCDVEIGFQIDESVSSTFQDLTLAIHGGTSYNFVQIYFSCQVCFGVT
jgi:hypothetical protein